MKPILLLVAAGLLLSLGGLRAVEPLSPVTEASSIGRPPPDVFETTACTITKVDVSDEVVSVAFTGRWVPLPNFQWAATDQNGFTIERDKFVSKADWDDFVARFKTVRGQAITLTVSTHGNYAIRGGIPFFHFPRHEFRLSK